MGFSDASLKVGAVIRGLHIMLIKYSLHVECSLCNAHVNTGSKLMVQGLCTSQHGRIAWSTGKVVYSFVCAKLLV